MLSITIAGPKIGTTAVVGLLIAGQLVAATLIDRYGWFGFDRVALDWPRFSASRSSRRRRPHHSSDRREAPGRLPDLDVTWVTVDTIRSRCRAVVLAGAVMAFAWRWAAR